MDVILAKKVKGKTLHRKTKRKEIDMKLWVDTIPAPNGYEWAKSVNQAKHKIVFNENIYKYNPLYCDDCKIELIDIGSDAGEYASQGGNYIKLLEWLVKTERAYLINLHSKDSESVNTMRTIISSGCCKEANR